MNLAGYIRMACVRFGLLAFIISLTACNPHMTHTSASALPTTPRPPNAAKKPFTVASPNGNRQDEYYWLRDDKRENKEMLAHLAAENAYADAMLAHTKAL